MARLWRLTLFLGATGTGFDMKIVETKTVVKVAIDGVVREAPPDELLIDLLNRAGSTVPQVCYHPQLGPIQTCDTCMVEANGRWCGPARPASRME